MSLQELEQDPFDPDEFVERLAWRTSGGAARDKDDDFDPIALHEAFEKTIRDLREMNVRFQKKVDKLEERCKEEEKAHWLRVGELQKKNQSAFGHFQALDERINFVATKVVHLGDQLEGVNTPRARDAEALQLINYFSEFLGDEPLKSTVFTDPFQLQLAADIIQKLLLIAQELPQGDRFDNARKRISDKYDQIEKELIEDFVHAHHEGDKRRMKRVATVLSHFKGYNQCIDAFVEESQKGLYENQVFQDIPGVCARTNTLIQEVFTNPEVVMAKLVLNIYHVKLQKHINTVLSDKYDAEKYLENLYQLYSKTTRLNSDVTTYKLGSDSSFLHKLTKSIFARYLDNYPNVEVRFLKDKCTAILLRYYDAKGHQKKQISSGGIHDLRRDIQAVLGTKANINIGPSIENYGGETFLSHEVAINLLQESKLAFKRCQALSNRSEMAANAVQIFDILVQHLCVEHIDYAIELGLQAIPLPDPKQKPEIYFFDVVTQANTIFHLFEKQFSDSLVPLVSSSPKHSECLHKKREIMESMENKLDIGLDRTLATMIGWIRHILVTEQKKTDFKPDSEDGMMQMYSQACSKVVKYLDDQLTLVKENLDGKNVEKVLTELGIRFHRVIYEHLQQYQYSSMGAMLAICDINEYRKCVKQFDVPLIIQLFDTLHALCNLLVVVPDNLKQVCTGEQLAGFDKMALQSFVQLRADYKTARLVNHFK